MSGDFIRGNAALEAAKALNVIVHDHQSITFEGIPYYLVNAYEYDDWKMEHQAILTAAPTEAVEAMREIVSYLRSEYSAGRFPVPEHYVDTVEAALKAGHLDCPAKGFDVD
jgi:hypothetical protein